MKKLKIGDTVEVKKNEDIPIELLPYKTVFKFLFTMNDRIILTVKNSSEAVRKRFLAYK